MHFVTSSLLLSTFLRVLQNPIHKANLLRAYLPAMIVLVLTLGRPNVVGDPREDEDHNPWPAMLESALYAPDSHVLATMRTLIYAAQKYGDTPPGGVIGAFSTKDGKEMHKGMAKVDGSIFVRSAGMLMNYMGWTGHGQTPREDWDRSGLGWDAWNGD